MHSPRQWLPRAPKRIATRGATLTRHPHESVSWTAYLNRRDGPADPAAFRDLMQHADYPRASAYDAEWVHRNSMGPNALWLTDALTQDTRVESGTLLVKH